jgi:NitT/TauT family transport system substrate-binding protein
MRLFHRVLNIAASSLHPVDRSWARERASARVRAGRRAMVFAVGIFGAVSVQAASPTVEPFVFITNWYAQAEHGGYYEAQASGLYKKAGLDVTLKMGGPQVNVTQLLAAGQADCIMGASDGVVLFARAQGVPLVTVAAIFQKDPQGIVAHPEVAKIEDLKRATLLIPSTAYTTYWPWLKEKYGLSDAQTHPYTFNYQPFMASKDVAQQGYVTYDPYAVEKQMHIKPKFFLLSDYGWPAYANTVVCSEKTIKERPAALQAFLNASLKGWQQYLNGDTAAANALIKKDDPDMTDDQIAFAIKTMKSRGIVGGGDAAKLGIGVITDARLKASYDFFVHEKLIDPAKVDLTQTYTTAFVKDLHILP